MSDEPKLVSEAERLREIQSDNSPMGLLARMKMALGHAAPPAPDEDVMVVALAWADRRVIGCVKDECSVCRKNVALSPSAQAMILNHDKHVRVYCWKCAEQETGVPPEGIMLGARIVPSKGMQ